MRLHARAGDKLTATNWKLYKRAWQGVQYAQADSTDCSAYIQ